VSAPTPQGSPGSNPRVATRQSSTLASATPIISDPLLPLNVEGASQVLDLSHSAVRGLFQRGELPGRKIGRRWFTTREALADWLNNRPEPRPEPRKRGRAPAGEMKILHGQAPLPGDQTDEVTR
jgi:hypothetical protein